MSPDKQAQLGQRLKNLQANQMVSQFHLQG